MRSPARPGDVAGAETLESMSAAPRYNAWMYEAIADVMGRRILEVGSGIGNMSAFLLSGEPERLILTDLDPFYRERLNLLFADRPEVRIDQLRLPDPNAKARFATEAIDTIVALNVVEHIEDDIGALRTMREILAPNGRIVILVPALQSIYGEMDKELGHFRRYSKRTLADRFRRAGFRVERLTWFNRVGVAGWWFNGRVRKLSRIPVDQLRRFDGIVPWLRMERFLPLPFGQSVIGVGVPK
jgi:SAM-dependent methyltransferase